MFDKVLKTGLVLLMMAACGTTASADVIHFTVPVSVNQLRVVSQATSGQVWCYVGGSPIAPLDVNHARNLVGSNYGVGHTNFSLASGSYQGTLHLDVDIGSHTVAQMRSWYCLLTFDNLKAFSFQHDLSAPYSPETFGNVGSPIMNAPTTIHVVPH